MLFTHSYNVMISFAFFLSLYIILLIVSCYYKLHVILFE